MCICTRTAEVRPSNKLPRFGPPSGLSCPNFLQQKQNIKLRVHVKNEMLYELCYSYFEQCQLRFSKEKPLLKVSTYEVCFNFAFPYNKFTIEMRNWNIALCMPERLADFAIENDSVSQLSQLFGNIIWNIPSMKWDGYVKITFILYNVRVI